MRYPWVMCLLNHWIYMAAYWKFKCSEFLQNWMEIRPLQKVPKKPVPLILIMGIRLSKTKFSVFDLEGNLINK